MRISAEFVNIPVSLPGGINSALQHGFLQGRQIRPGTNRGTYKQGYSQGNAAGRYKTTTYEKIKYYWFFPNDEQIRAERDKKNGF
jgi:hypothetical protein